ncbi:MAG: amidohydrolase family protein [Bryobacteraceae bacterium]|nr:amidohydrolase family protein [Bryobacteraceae bacterium]
MRIDAHQHFWDLSRFAYPWMPEGSLLCRDFLPVDLSPILARNDMDGCVVVQATTVPEEAEWLFHLALQYDFISGVVCWLDLTAADLGNRLDDLQKNEKFAGVRHPVHDEADPKWLLRPDVVRGLKELAKRNIPYDLLVRPVHLPFVYQLAEQLPELRMIIDHIGKPEIAAHVMEPWSLDMERLAGIPHMHVKLSGMVTEAQHNSWSAQDLRPYVQHVWNQFGPERCVFGSDWPVCLLAASWKEVLAACTQALGPVASDTREGLMGLNAVRFYKLPV